MGFMDRIRNSWQLVKLSWHLLMQDKELLFFPVISTIAAIGLFIGIVLPSLWVSEDFSLWFFALWYFTTGFVTIFMNAALFACVKKRLHGGDPTIGYGLKEASKHLLPIFIWSLITTTVGLILRILDQFFAERDDIIGAVARVLVAIAGAAWTIMTMFVIPVIIVEKLPVGAAIRRSASLFKKTWGENVAADIGMGLAFLGLWLLGILVGVVTLLTMPATVFFIVLAVLLVYFAVLAITQSTLSMIFDSVLYSYATGDNVPLQFKHLVEKTFVHKAAKH
jgi:hypothetical protein